MLLHNPAQPDPLPTRERTGDEAEAPLETPRHRPLTVAVVGIDGSGKTTAASHLAALLADGGYPAQFRANPSARGWLKRATGRLGFQLLDRAAERFETVVRLANVLHSSAAAARFEGITFMDRHLACQLVSRQVRGLPAGRLLAKLGRDGLLGFGRPDAVVLLDVDPATAWERIILRGQDSETFEYLRAARQAYLARARAEGWTVIDANQPAVDVLRDLWAATAALPRHGAD